MTEIPEHLMARANAAKAKAALHNILHHNGETAYRLMIETIQGKLTELHGFKPIDARWDRFVIYYRENGLTISDAYMIAYDVASVADPDLQRDFLQMESIMDETLDPRLLGKATWAKPDADEIARIAEQNEILPSLRDLSNALASGNRYIPRPIGSIARDGSTGSNPATAETSVILDALRANAGNKARYGSIVNTSFSFTEKSDGTGTITLLINGGGGANASIALDFGDGSISDQEIWGAVQELLKQMTPQ